MSKGTEQSRESFEAYASEKYGQCFFDGRVSKFDSSIGKYTSLSGDQYQHVPKTLNLMFEVWQDRDPEIKQLREENERLKGIKQFLIDDFEKEWMGQSVYGWMLSAIDHFFAIKAAKEAKE